MTALPNTPLGEVTREGESVVLTYDRSLAHPQDKVWRALTESEHLHHWFPADIVGERRAGASIVLPFWPEASGNAESESEGSAEAHFFGEILTWDPPHRFEFTWDTERIAFDLSPTDDGTRLVTTVHVFVPAERGWPSNAAGYHACLDALEACLEGRRVNIFEQASIPALEPVYAERG